MNQKIIYEIIEFHPENLRTECLLSTIIGNIIYFVSLPIISIFYFFKNPRSLLVFLRLLKTYNLNKTDITPYYYKDRNFNNPTKVKMIYGKKAFNLVNPFRNKINIDKRDQELFSKILVKRKFAVRVKYIKLNSNYEEKPEIVLTTNKPFILAKKYRPKCNN